MDRIYDRIGTDDGVEVWNTFTQTWIGGFAIAEVMDAGIRVRRMSDGAVLPILAPDRVRARGRLAPIA